MSSRASQNSEARNLCPEAERARKAKAHRRRRRVLGAAGLDPRVPR